MVSGKTHLNTMQVLSTTQNVGSHVRELTKQLLINVGSWWPTLEEYPGVLLDRMNSNPPSCTTPVFPLQAGQYYCCGHCTVDSS